MTKREFKLGENGNLFIEPSFETLPLQPDEAPLVLSIQKWQAIVDHLHDGHLVTECGNWSTCGLCQAHLRTVPGQFCKHCPIYEHTGFRECRHTPYEAWACLPQSPESVRVRIVVAEQETKFLKSLEGQR